MTSSGAYRKHCPVVQSAGAQAVEVACACRVDLQHPGCPQSCCSVAEDAGFPSPHTQHQPIGIIYTFTFIQHLQYLFAWHTECSVIQNVLHFLSHSLLFYVDGSVSEVPCSPRVLKQTSLQPPLLVVAALPPFPLSM